MGRVGEGGGSATDFVYAISSVDHGIPGGYPLKFFGWFVGFTLQTLARFMSKFRFVTNLRVNYEDI